MTGAEIRSKSTDESVKKLEVQSQNYMSSNDSKIEYLGKHIGMLIEKLIPQQGGILGSAPTEGLQIMGSGSRHRLGENGDSSLGQS